MSQALTDTFNTMKERYKPGVLAQPTTFYFSLGENEGQKWVMRLTPQDISVEPGKTSDADVMLKTSEERFLKMVRGEWTPGVMDFMRGRIKSNDPTKLQMLKDCFEH